MIDAEENRDHFQGARVDQSKEELKWQKYC